MLMLLLLLLFNFCLSIFDYLCFCMLSFFFRLFSAHFWGENAEKRAEQIEKTLASIKFNKIFRGIDFRELGQDSREFLLSK